MSVTRERVLDELDVDVFVCFSWKFILDTPKLGIKGTGGVSPTDPPETLPGAAEYAMAISTFKPMNCAFTGDESKRNRIVKHQDKQNLIKCLFLFSIRGSSLCLEIKPNTKTHHVATKIVFFASGFILQLRRNGAVT